MAAHPAVHSAYYQDDLVLAQSQEVCLRRLVLSAVITVSNPMHQTGLQLQPTSFDSYSYWHGSVCHCKVCWAPMPMSLLLEQSSKRISSRGIQ